MLGKRSDALSPELQCLAFLVLICVAIVSKRNARDDTGFVVEDRLDDMWPNS